MAIPWCLPAPLVLVDCQPKELSPELAIDALGLVGDICRSVEANQGLLQQISQSVDVTHTLATGLKGQWDRFSREIETEEESIQAMVRVLYKEMPIFSYYILALPDIKRILFKRRLVQMAFRVFDKHNCPAALPNKQKYVLKAFTSLPPYHEVQSTASGRPLIVGDTLVEVEGCDRFEFCDVAFTAGSSKYPLGTFNLVVMCIDSMEIEPLVVEQVNVRLKCKKVMILKNRRKKKSKLEKIRSGYL